MIIIDSHLHFRSDDPQTERFPVEEGMKFLNVCVAKSGWREKAQTYQRLARTYPEHYAWCTTFDLPGFDDASYHQHVIEGLEDDFAAGAAGCKLWKHVGMELRNPAGEYVLPDDAIFDPIYSHLAQRGWTLLAHIAEPLACWMSLDPASPHYGYYRDNPQWHMAGRADVPSHQALMSARDHVLQKHPGLRVVGAHLGSMEYSLKEISERLEKYPNFAVDTSGRLEDLAANSRSDLLEFILLYQDRLLWGTDVVYSGTGISDWLRSSFVTDKAFCQTDAVLQINNKTVQGLALPERIQEKLFRTNARNWYPGL